MPRDARKNPLPGDIFREGGLTIVVLETSDKAQEVVYAAQPAGNGFWHLGRKSLTAFWVDTEHATIQRS